MKILTKSIEKYAIVNTDIGEFRVDSSGTVEFLKESQYGFYSYVLVDNEFASEFSIELFDVAIISKVGVDMIESPK